MLRDFRAHTPVAGVRCQVAPLVNDERSPVIPPGEAVTDDTGAFTLDHAPAGSMYALRWNDAAHPWAVRRVALEASGTADVDVWTATKTGQPIRATLGADLSGGSIFTAVFTRVTPGGPAAKAGLRDGDIVLSVDGARVLDVLGMAGVVELIMDRPPGSTVKLGFQRGAVATETSLVLGPE